ncbi:hypothetical protein [Hydrogenophaga sp.]|uniref:hypothetical protein n=1 Tax=Hydrogenophaga sp. TaxID=1904254 RepID=UPI00271B2C8F|nr:hypothetical protein [Hydrogenophaga sp.]MDO9438313.1 hypothetical protein [Hydrogenophaga sp.]
MSSIFRSPQHARGWLATAVLLVCLPAAWAQTPADKAAIEAAYNSDRAACQALSPTQDRTACLRDAGAHRDQALRQGVRSPSPQELERNALQRCKTQPPGDQARCERMARGEGNVSGSVSGGGTIRELVTQEPLPPMPAPPPPMPSTPMEPTPPNAPVKPLMQPIAPPASPARLPGG